MSDEEDRSKRRPYKVGYGKPPKVYQFKPKNGEATEGKSKRSKTSKRSTDGPEQVNLAPLFAEPVRVSKKGRVESMDPFEGLLRKQVEQAIKKGSHSSIKAVIDVAIEHDLVKRPPPAPGGGVLLVPLRTEEDLVRYQRTFFPDDPTAPWKAEDDHE
jgi:hypothetical protein